MLRSYPTSIANLDPAVTVFLGGGADVDTAAGFPLRAGATVSIELRPGDGMWAVCGNGESAELAILTGSERVD